MNKKKSNVKPIKPTIGGQLLETMYGGKTFIQALIECIKNSRDYGANFINIITNIANVLMVIDDGEGMGEDNREAFCSLNSKKTHRKGRSGHFGTGTKAMFYGFSDRVDVVTAPIDADGHIITFGFSRAEYQKTLLTETSIIPDEHPRNKDTWAHDFRTGTQIVFTLQKSKNILCGPKLAAELAARLPRSFQKIIRIDGVPLPEKEMIGEPIEREINTLFGTIFLEVYRPKEPHAEETLGVGGVDGEIGEIPMTNFYKILGDNRGKLPAIFLQRAVCGTIRHELFAQYVNEDRQTLKPEIAQDPKTLHLLRALREIAPEIQETLGVQEKEKQIKSSAEAVFAQLHNHYAKTSREKPKIDDPDLAVNAKSTVLKQGKAANALTIGSLEIDQEQYQIGETITAKMVWARGVNARPCSFDTSLAKSRDIKQDSSTLTMIANEVGEGKITISVNGWTTTVTFDIVERRKLEIQGPKTIAVGKPRTLRVLNRDKMKGKPQWQIIDGFGELSATEGDEVMITGKVVGGVHVLLTDSQNLDNQAETLIDIELKPQKRICIRGTWFTIEATNTDSSLEFAKPVTMIRSVTGKVHNLIINPSSPGYKEAEESGNFTVMLTCAIATEYARFSRIDLAEDEVQDRDLSTVYAQIQADLALLLNELLTITKG
jgi:hypothetical protein